MSDNEPRVFVAVHDQDNEYPSYNDCVLDIIANTDCGVHAAQIAAIYVYNAGWEYDDTDMPRGVVIEGPGGQRIELREVT